MKTLLKLIAISTLLATCALAAPIDCPDAYMDTYLASGFSCKIDNLVFSNFGFSNPANPPGIAIPASSVHVLPITTPFNEGFNFNPLMSVLVQPSGAQSAQDVRINFIVSTLDNSSTITDLHLEFNGSYYGTGHTNVTEQYCLGGTTICNAPNGGNIQGNNPPGTFASDLVFAGVSQIYVSKDISASSGIGANGSASISQVINTFSQTSSVPEPATLALIGGGLLALGVVRRRQQKKA